MSFELILGLGAVGIVVGVVVGNYFLVRALGAQEEKLDDAQEKTKRATKQLEKRTDPVLPDAAHVERLRRIQNRLARLRDRAPK